METLYSILLFAQLIVAIHSASAAVNKADGMDSKVPVGLGSENVTDTNVPQGFKSENVPDTNAPQGINSENVPDTSVSRGFKSLHVQDTNVSPGLASENVTEIINGDIKETASTRKQGADQPTPDGIPDVQNTDGIMGRQEQETVKGNTKFSDTRNVSAGVGKITIEHKDVIDSNVGAGDDGTKKVAKDSGGSQSVGAVRNIMDMGSTGISSEGPSGGSGGRHEGNGTDIRSHMGSDGGSHAGKVIGLKDNGSDSQGGSNAGTAAGMHASDVIAGESVTGHGNTTAGTVKNKTSTSITKGRVKKHRKKSKLDKNKVSGNITTDCKRLPVRVKENKIIIETLPGYCELEFKFNGKRRKIRRKARKLRENKNQNITDSGMFIGGNSSDFSIYTNNVDRKTLKCPKLPASFQKGKLMVHTTKDVCKVVIQFPKYKKKDKKKGKEKGDSSVRKLPTVEYVPYEAT